jgi:serine/threonine-protein phosphatase 2A regulatory subunit B
MKPASIEELTEVITTAHFHPTHCNLFAFGTSKGYVKLCDMRAAALCDRHAKVFRREEEGHPQSFFSELISSISDLSFSPDGRYFVTRDYMHMKVWDLAMESQPIMVVPVHDAIKPKLCDLYENDSIFDKFECSFTFDGSQVMSGSYSNLIRFTPIKDRTNSTVVQADKGIFRASKKGSRSKLSGSKSAARLDDPTMAGELDFERKILHAALHPRENTVAVAALCNLFIFSQV